MEKQNQQTVQEKTETKPPTKINWKLIAIVAVLGLVVGIGAIFLLRGFSPALITPTPPIVQQIPPPTPQPQVLDTSDWQTYRNDEFGFEVKYPRDWSSIGEISEQPVFLSPDGKVKIYTRVHVSGTREYIYSLAYKEEEECPERIFKPGEPVVAPGAACPIVKTKGTKAINIHGVSGYFKERESGSMSAYLPRPDEKIAIELTTRYSDYKDVFNQILSTFRFVE